MIEELILNHEHTMKYTWRDWFFGSVDGPVHIPGVGTVSVEKRESAFDYDPWMILRVENGTETKYYRKTFYNSSFGFDEIGSFDEVFPTTRTITEFK